jgi:hypothetical protein
MISNKLYSLALLVIFILSLMQIINFFNQKQTIIEENKEHMNPALLTHQYDSYAPVPSDVKNINFYYKNNRFAVENRGEPELIDPLITDPRLGCGPKFDWSTKVNPGANNVYGDLLWHKTSPKMILEKNCLNCNDFKSNKLFDEPVGMTSELTDTYDNGMVIGSLSDQRL